MKSLLLSALILGGISNAALANNDLTKASFKALEEASFQVEENSIVAWQAASEGHEILVNVKNVQGAQIDYGCHFHGPSMFCHEESFKEAKHLEDQSETTLDFIKSAYSAALAKFTKTLKRQKLDASAISAIKVWTPVHEEDDDHDHDHDHDHAFQDDHEHGANVWTKFNYSRNGQSKAIYVLCHVHGGENEFACHFSLKGEEEPTL